MSKLLAYFVLLLWLLTTACNSDPVVLFDHLEEYNIETIQHPIDNLPTASKWELGKALFFDRRLSKDSSTSCASCHNQSNAFAQNQRFPKGFNQLEGQRNAPSIANIGMHPFFTREGGVPTLEMQVLIPFQEHNEFNFNLIDASNLLKQDSSYQVMSMEAYSREFDYFVITRALALFERSLTSSSSLYDQARKANDPSLLSEEILRGMDLFFSDKANCSKCHSGFNFTNYSFENNGIYESYADSGRMRLTHLESDRALFKVASLRNLAYTAPYMHDGSFATIEDVIEHYNSGGADHKNKSGLMRPLNLSNSEKKELLAFLQSINDDGFVEKDLNEFKYDY